MSRRFMGFVASGASLAVAVGLSGSAMAATTQHPYVALGDSISVGAGAGSPAKSFVQLLESDYKSSLGANTLINEAQPTASSTSLQGSQLSAALADINASSDTRAATLEIGGIDALFGPCPGNWDDSGTCPFRANFRQVESELYAALARDPGAERFVAMAYYNPYAGTGTAQESAKDQTLLGANLQVGCTDTGSDVGLNDAIFQGAGKVGLPVANPYPAFEQAGQSFVASDQLHPNDAGHAAIAKAFGHPSARCGSSPDRNPPDTRFKAGPTSGKTHDRTPTFKFKSSESRSQFKCSLGRGRHRRCSSPHTTRKLSFGRHTFTVVAKDRAGNADPKPARGSFKVVR